MAKLIVSPQKTPLSGTVSVPGDKSISHRAVMLGGLAEGVSRVRRWLPAGDTLATLQIMRELGVSIAVDEVSPTAWDLTIEGRGLHGLQQAKGVLDCKNAGTCMRLIAGILAGQAFPSQLDGSSQLRKRPMRRILTPLSQMGANIQAIDGRAPLTIQPAPLQPIRYQMPVASAQVKSAILLAGLYAEGETAVYQPGPARDHTERMLEACGVTLQESENWITLPQAPTTLKPLNLTVPADISSAAFLLVAAGIVPHSNITLSAIGINNTRTGILEMLAQMGAGISQANKRQTGGEWVADLNVQFDELHATDIDGSVVVRGIDEFPILMVAATQAAGKTTVRDAAELRVKEVDRIAVLSAEMGKMGVQIEEHPDGFTVHGPVRPRGAEVDSHDDHRLGMALAVMGLLAQGETSINHAECVADSFPGFVETMQAIGASMRWES